MATGSVIFSPFGRGSVLISSGAGFEPEIQYKWQILLLLVCTWRQGGHVGGQEQKHFSPLGTKLYSHVTSSRKNSSVLTSNATVLSRCWKPRMFFTDFPPGVACEQDLHLQASRRVTQELHTKQTFQPPSHVNLEVLKKKVQKNLETGASNLEISKICVKLKKQQQIICLSVFLPFWLRCRRRIRVTLWFRFALEFWTTSSHFEICACVRRLSFPRDLSAPMFHWNWHCTQVFSQIILINSAVMNTDYSIFLHTLRNFLAISRFSGSPWDLEAKPWDRDMASQTVRVRRSAKGDDSGRETAGGHVPLAVPFACHNWKVCSQATLRDLIKLHKFNQVKFVGR